MADEQTGIPPALALFVVGMAVVLYGVYTMDRAPPKKKKYGKAAWRSR
jgi:hypothetical protein